MDDMNKGREQMENFTKKLRGEDINEATKSEAFMEKTIDHISDLSTYIRRIIQTDKDIKKKVMSDGQAIAVAKAMGVMRKFATFLSNEMDERYK